MGPEKRLFAFSDPLPVRPVRGVGRRPVAAVVRTEDEKIRKRQRERARIMALLLGAFVILLFAITIAKTR